MLQLYHKNIANAILLYLQLSNSAIAKDGSRDFSLPPRYLYRIYQFRIYNFHCSIPDIIHSPHPQHHIGCFEFFGYIFFFSKVFHQPRKKSLCLLFNIGKIWIKVPPAFSKIVFVILFYLQKFIYLERGFSRLWPLIFLACSSRLSICLCPKTLRKSL